MLEGHVDAAGDVHALLVKGDQYRTILAVKTLRAVVVTNVEDGLSRDRRHVDRCARSDFARDDAQSRRQ